MGATFYIGDALEVMAKLPEKSVDLVLTSPPFLALRSYLPADHPDKAKEGGSQATPGEFIDWLIDIAEACDRVLAPHGSMCIELGDTYAGSGGGGGDYLEGGWREGQAQFAGSAASMKESNAAHWRQKNSNAGAWPLAKSLSLIPELFRFSLVYGFNPLTGRQTERWRLRNVVRWVRPNPPVGALGDKFRPATSELMVFCKSAKRYFDLDAVREPHKPSPAMFNHGDGQRGGGMDPRYPNAKGPRHNDMPNPAGAPPLDWWKIPASDPSPPNQDGYSSPHLVGGDSLDWWNIPLLEGEEETRYGPKEPKPRILETNKGVGKKRDDYQGPAEHLASGRGSGLQNMNGAPPLDWWEIPPGGYEGAHYAVFPPELCVKPIKAMCPEKVCRVCGEPSRRLTEQTEDYAEFRLAAKTMRKDPGMEGAGKGQGGLAGSGYNRDPHGVALGSPTAIHRSGEKYRTTGWSDCGHDDWRPGMVLDCFAGSGTTLAVATGYGRDAIGIDLDERNYELALERVGPFILTLGNVGGEN